MVYRLADGSMSTDYKIGDKFVVVIGSAFKKDSVIEFIRDDGSRCPLFELVEGECDFKLGRNNKDGAFKLWADIVPLNKQSLFQRIKQKVLSWFK